MSLLCTLLMKHPCPSLLVASPPTPMDDSPWLPDQVELITGPLLILASSPVLRLRLWLSVARSHTPCPSTNQRRLISKKMARCLAKLTPKCLRIVPLPPPTLLLYVDADLGPPTARAEWVCWEWIRAS